MVVSCLLHRQSQLLGKERKKKLSCPSPKSQNSKVKSAKPDKDILKVTTAFLSTKVTRVNSTPTKVIELSWAMWTVINIMYFLNQSYFTFLKEKLEERKKAREKNMKVVSDILTKFWSRMEQTDNRRKALISTTHISFKKLNYIYWKKIFRTWCITKFSYWTSNHRNLFLLFCQASVFLLNFDPH